MPVPHWTEFATTAAPFAGIGGSISKTSRNARGQPTSSPRAAFVSALALDNDIDLSTENDIALAPKHNINFSAETEIKSRTEHNNTNSTSGVNVVDPVLEVGGHQPTTRFPAPPAPPPPSEAEGSLNHPEHGPQSIIDADYSREKDLIRATSLIGMAARIRKEMNNSVEHIT